MKKLLFILLAFAPLLMAAEPTTMVHFNINCTSSTTPVVTAGRARFLLLLINDSDTAIYLNVAGGDAVVDAGIRLNANGGVLYMDTALPNAAVSCIHGSTGNKVLMVTLG